MADDEQTGLGSQIPAQSTSNNAPTAQGEARQTNLVRPKRRRQQLRRNLRKLKGVQVQNRTRISRRQSRFTSGSTASGYRFGQSLEDITESPQIAPSDVDFQASALEPLHLPSPHSGSETQFSAGIEDPERGLCDRCSVASICKVILRFLISIVARVLLFLVELVGYTGSETV
ncbi:hypothetical protein N7492_005179 [Penicillium capsulatum]|uniref:Uncharacterized protein n=1 Tax=Penicillium capsulatum TaxID=69766 RepID=A0A9W9LRF0_9EURO|nr:hypothetical protein N7492_005179 [Penicillium capsulatum]KAJ6135716.1 hypothetical protein N7512_000876 [Penicillium capsulatum]